MLYEGKMWKKVTYPGVRKDFYMVSEDGEVISIISMQKCKAYDNGGYLRYTLLCEGEKIFVNVLAHRLVAWEFVPNPNNYPIIDHIDGVKNHNHYTNLDWVTPKENNHRARKMGLINDQGFNHSSSLFSEELVRSICEKFEDGWSIKEVYRWLRNDPKAKPNDDTQLYGFIHRLKHRLGWKNITKDYVYDTKSAKRGKWDKQPPGVGNNIYDEKMIRDICQHLENGKSVQDILELYTGSRYQRDNRKIYDLIDGIRRKLHWTEISCEYKIENSSTRTRSNGWDPIIAELVDTGYSASQIAKKFGIHYEKDGREFARIRRMVDRYKNFKNISKDTTIYIEDNLQY